MGIEVTKTGPLFDGSLTRAIENATEEGALEIGDFVVDRVRARLGQVLRHPTGRYRRSIQTNRAHDGVVVNDGGIIYGPWLEGTGSRNRRTRFKGYATFRKTFQEIQRDAVRIMEDTIERRLP